LDITSDSKCIIAIGIFYKINQTFGENMSFTDVDKFLNYLIRNRIEEHKHEIKIVTNSNGKPRFKVAGQIGKHPQQYVIVDGEKYPQKWLVRLLFGISIRDSALAFHQTMAKDLLERLKFETRAFP